jgi:hypothetical protein
MENVQDPPPIFHFISMDNPSFPVRIFPEIIPMIPPTAELLPPRLWMDRAPSAGIEVAGMAFLGDKFLIFLGVWWLGF